MINWKLRYAALFKLEPSLSDPDRSILEVGCGTEGIARYLQRRIIGVDRIFSGCVNPYLQPVCASILHLPFSSASFEDVVCVDTLEHLEARERPAALLELIRVARYRVIISGPAGAFAQWGDASYAERLAQRRRSIPEWLQEHLQHGIPAFADLLEMLVGCAHPFTIHVNEGAIQHYSGLVADNQPFITTFLNMHERKFAREAPLARAVGDVPYSYLIAIDVASTAPSEANDRWPPSRPRAASPRRERAEIFAVGHRIDQMPEISGIRRIIAGAGCARPALGSDILDDASGDSIAHRNPDFSEMTAIYWVWKNIADLTGIGFCHYRRYFDFRKSAPKVARETRLCSPQELTSHRTAFVDRSVIAQTLEDGAIIVTRTTKEGVANAEQYMTAHVPDDYLAMVNYVLARHRHLAAQVVAHARDDGFYGNNMFLMRWTDFDQLCRFWFDCLFALDGKITSRSVGYQRRTLAFLSERLFDIYVRGLRDAGRRVVEYPLFFVEPPALAGSA